MVIRWRLVGHWSFLLSPEKMTLVISFVSTWISKTSMSQNFKMNKILTKLPCHPSIRFIALYYFSVVLLVSTLISSMGFYEEHLRWILRNFMFFSKLHHKGQRECMVWIEITWGPNSPAQFCCGLSVFQTFWLVNPFVTCFSWPTTWTSVVLPCLLLEVSGKKEKSHGKDDVFLGLSDDLTFLDDKLNAGIEKLSHTRWK